MAILIDFSGIAMASAHQCINQGDQTADLLKHMILNSLRWYRRTYKEQYGELVICNDGFRNWRKEVFPNYKKKRKSMREASKVDWDVVFPAINEVYADLGKYFPYKTVRHERAEADDVIGAIVFDSQEFGRGEKTLIVSADKDFIQLHRFANVDQYSPRSQKMITMTAQDAIKEHLEHMLKGDLIDGVPNVLSDDDVMVTEGKRQVKLTAKIKQQLLDDPHALGPEVYSRIERNKKLIDLSLMPSDIRQEIINTYHNVEPGNRRRTLTYLINNRMNQLIDVVGDFI